MKRKDLTLIIIIGLAAAIFSWVIAGFIFRQPASRSAEVPVVPLISTDFPDVKNDPAYNFFLNKQALDPTQPVHIGGSNNSNPFGQ
ncbi:hypothetical protein HY380_02465 [Candidatus Saccharibacteria bacterium]|nr:hypothetical protein [Candidatus Saccharibacteria bacterium]